MGWRGNAPEIVAHPSDGGGGFQRSPAPQQGAGAGRLDYPSQTCDKCRMTATEIKAGERPTASELTLLKSLWAVGRLSAKEIHDRTSAETRWSYSSTRKTLDRMEAKGLVAVESFHGLKIYAARAKKLATLAALITDFARDVLGASTPPAAAAFSDSAVLSPDEIEDLQALLDGLAAASKKRKR